MQRQTNGAFSLVLWVSLTLAIAILAITSSSRQRPWDTDHIQDVRLSDEGKTLEIVLRVPDDYEFTEGCKVSPQIVPDGSGGADPYPGNLFLILINYRDRSGQSLGALYGPREPYQGPYLGNVLNARLVTNKISQGELGERVVCHVVQYLTGDRDRHIH